MTSRQLSVPVDHLIAEMAAFPLASVHSLERRMVSLDPRVDGETRALWRQAEGRLLGAMPGFAVDELVSYRDWIWFGGAMDGEFAASPIALGRYLEGLAHLVLDLGDDSGRNSFVPSSMLSPEARRRTFWRWLTFALPVDLILAAHPQGPGGLPTIAPQVERWLADRRYAESHVHLGACLDFTVFWSALMARLASSELGGEAFRSPGAEFDEGSHLGSWLIRAAIGRLVLGASLGYPGQIPEHLEEILDPALGGVLRRDGLVGLALVRHALGDLDVGRLTPWAEGTARDPFSYSHLRRIYRSMLPPESLRPPRSRLDVLTGDPLVTTMWGPDRAPPDEFGVELEFQRVMLARLRTGRVPERGCLGSGRFERLFWQVQRVRNIFYRHSIQRPMVPGLPWFLRFYDRMRPTKQRIGIDASLDCALRLAGEGHGLHALEVRTAPERTTQGNLHIIDRLNSRRASDVELGLVLHLVRVRDDGRWARGVPRSYGVDTGVDVTAPTNRGWRFGALRRAFSAQARSLLRALEATASDGRLDVLRGFDVCTDEYGVPLWMVGPVFTTLRREAGRILRRKLSATAHAGEDYVHLLGGLRRIEESVRMLELEAGDRVGHGLALGVDAERWAAERGQVVITLEQRLLDLAWVWSRSEGALSGVLDDRASSVEKELARLANELFGHHPRSLDALTSAIDLLHDRHFLTRLGYPDRRAPLSPPGARPNENPEDLAERYLTDPEVFRRGQRLIALDPNAEGRMLARIQDGLKRRLEAGDLAVEVNPSSNLLVGNLSDLRRHPLWALRPFDGTSGLTVVVGSDDPLPFATDLRREYQLLSDAMVLAGVSPTMRWRWLDEVREAGLRCRFTAPRRTSPAFGGPRLRSRPGPDEA